MSRPRETNSIGLAGVTAAKYVGLLGVAGVLVLAACQESAPGDAEAGEVPVPAAESAEPAASEAAPAAEATGSALVDPEVATREDLLALPNMDEATADALVAGRPYENMLEVDEVLAQTLSAEQREALYGRLWKPLDLNTASAEEILLIPGVGERMQHEFEEYRPYRAIAQFRREIGKYVDEEEVARLEQYVTIR